MLGLYIHIPFCKNKCLYCDFPSFQSKEIIMKDYVKALCIEIEARAKDKVDTIFIGGGTPTYLDLESIEILGATINKIKKSDDFEFTIEGNPGTFTDEKLRTFKDMGVNRLSIGLQACQNNLLKNLGRIHSYEEFLNSLSIARSIGFNNINIDLMYGLPEQSVDMWRETLNKVIELSPEHISAYSLIIEDGTPYYDLNLKKGLNLPNEDDERKMNELTLNLLNKNSFSQYEISNFSKRGKECRHNLIYWNLDDYIGCGSGAHSFVKGERISNFEIPEEYISSIISNGNGIKEIIINEKNDTIEEYMFMGLRKIEGVSFKEFKKRFNVNLVDLYKNIIEKYLKGGLIEINEDYIRLTEKGITFSNIVMSDFLLG